MAGIPEIWVLEDDDDLQAIYACILGKRYQIKTFGSLAAFETALKTHDYPNLLIADLRLPEKTFIDYCRSAPRDLLSAVPFMVISGLDDIDLLREFYGFGALDYLVKPFKKNELIVKVERCLNLVGKESRQQSVEGPNNSFFEVDPVYSQIVFKNGQKLGLTNKEMLIISQLSRAPHLTLSRPELIDRVWPHTKVTSKTLDVHLFNLRKKVEPLGLSIKHLPPNRYCIEEKLTN